MRLFHAAVAPFLIGRLVLGCNTVSPDECWVNTSGGFGGGGTIPIGAGVGATSGDFPSPPPASSARLQRRSQPLHRRAEPVRREVQHGLRERGH
jgi:hypothetical protein